MVMEIFKEQAPDVTLRLLIIGFGTGAASPDRPNIRLRMGMSTR